MVGAVQRARGISESERVSRPRCVLLPSAFSRSLAVVLLLFAACTPAQRTPPARADEWLEFGGSWTATGTRRTLDLGPERRATVFDLSGSLELTGEKRPAVGFRAQAIGMSDSSSGMQGRAVWTDESGEQVYSELRGEMLGEAKHVTGTITGGTGRYSRVSGEYGFEWQYVLTAEDGSVSGRAIGLRGRARLSPPVP